VGDVFWFIPTPKNREEKAKAVEVRFGRVESRGSWCMTGKKLRTGRMRPNVKKKRLRRAAYGE